MTYKIKGNGDVCEVVDEKDVLVGRLHRRTWQEVRMKISGNCGSLRRLVLIVWSATHPDGTPVCWRGGMAKEFDVRKRWTEPDAWLRETKGQSEFRKTT